MHLNWKNISAVALIGVAAFLLWYAHPAENRYAPQCPLHQHTGLFCSGCGSLRAIHFLLHGELAAAWKMNPLTVLLIPPLAFLAIAELFFHQYKWANQIKPRYLFGLIGLFILFGILRNIPAFATLAPH